MILHVQTDFVSLRTDVIQLTVVALNAFILLKRQPVSVIENIIVAFNEDEVIVL